ncbi:MAG: 6-phospho 3-hexuloisomerase [Clostridiales bacterium]|jgi:6-phospho-3-hexuloisomerase|nr:6-phospho 3-hexuloisomerase [Clostridiales bacterium]
MSNIIEFSGMVVDELKETLLQIDEQGAQHLMEEIKKAKKIYVAGAGRSLLMLRAFAMRLMHLGLNSYVVGDTTTPALEKGDLILLGTGSGLTRTLECIGEKAKNIGATVGVITISPDSPVGKLADFHVIIPGRSSKQQGLGKSIQPGGGRFEQSLLIFLDSVIANLSEELGFDVKKGYSRHANLE